MTNSITHGQIIANPFVNAELMSTKAHSNDLLGPHPEALQIVIGLVLLRSPLDKLLVSFPGIFHSTFIISIIISTWYADSVGCHLEGCT